MKSISYDDRMFPIVSPDDFRYFELARDMHHQIKQVNDNIYVS